MASDPGRPVPAALQESESPVWWHWGVDPKVALLEIGAPPRRIRVHEVGSGPPVLMVHGTGGYGPYWAPLVSELRGFRSIVLDRPGWGASDPIDYSESPYRGLVADLLVDVLDGLGVDKAHAVGASIGDTWALALASRHPDRVHSVTLLGGGPLTDEVRVPPPIRLLGSPVGVLMARVRWRERLELTAARKSGHGPALDDGRMPNVYVDWKVAMTNDTDWRVNERTMVRAVVGRGGWKPGLTFDGDDLSGLTVPVLMIYGTADPVESVDMWQRFVAQIPDGSLDLMEGAGHLPWFDDPGHVAALLRDHFLKATS